MPIRRVEAPSSASIASGSRQVDSRRPKRGRCRGRSRRGVGRCPARVDAPRRSSASSSRSTPSPHAAAGRVLEDEHRPPSGAVVGRRASARATPVGEPLDPGLDAGAAMRADVDVDEAGAERRARLAARRRRTSMDRSKKASSAPARLIRYAAWIATGPMSARARRSRNAGVLRRRLGAAAPGRRVVAEDLDARSRRSRRPARAALTIPSRRAGGRRAVGRRAASTPS